MKSGIQGPPGLRVRIGPRFELIVRLKVYDLQTKLYNHVIFKKYGYNFGFFLISTSRSWNRLVVELNPWYLLVRSELDFTIVSQKYAIQDKILNTWLLLHDLGVEIERSLHNILYILRSEIFVYCTILEYQYFLG